MVFPGMPILSIAKIMNKPGLKAGFQSAVGARASVKQASTMPGCLEANAYATPKGWGFAVSVWEDEDALMAYVRSGAHNDYAKRISKIANAHVSGHTSWDGPVPNWTEWGAFLEEHAKIIRLPGGEDLPEDECLSGPTKLTPFVFKGKRTYVP